MDLLEDLRMSLLNFNFVMIYIIYKFLVLIKNHLNYLKDNIFKYFFKEYNRLLFKNIFSQHMMIENSRSDKEKIIKDLRNLFRLRKELNCPAIKDVINLFRQEKETKGIKDRILADIKNSFYGEKRKLL